MLEQLKTQAQPRVRRAKKAAAVRLRRVSERLDPSFINTIEWHEMRDGRTHVLIEAGMKGNWRSRRRIVGYVDGQEFTP